MIRKINSWLLFIVCSSCFAQVDTAFLQHLSRNGLKREHRTYLNNVQAQSDRVSYAEAKFFLQYFSDSLFIRCYKRCSALCAADSALNGTADKLFLTNAKDALRDSWFSTIHTTQKNTTDRYFQNIYKASVDPNRYTADDFYPELRPSFLSYKRIYNKKPLLGALLSAAVPGLGKLYAGKARASLLTFLLNAGYAAQTLESGKKLGISHPFTIVNAAIFTVFYLSNIYGGYADIVTLRKERKKQFITHAADLYN